MRLPSREDCASNWTRLIYSRTGQAAVASVFLVLLAAGAPAQAQEPEGVPLPHFTVDWMASLDRTERPRDALLSVPRIDWADLSPDDEALPAGLADSSQQPAQPHPPPKHTGFKALFFETGSDFNAFPRRTSTWVILAIGGAAAAIAYPHDADVTASMAGSDAAGHFFAAGKYIGAAYVQASVAVGLYVVGRYILPHTEGEPRTNKVSHLGFDLLRGLIVSQALTQGIKIAVRRDRPTGECCAFPSGHSSATFATASVLERHLGYRGAWPTFVIASYVATSRLHDNRHYLSDVLFGSALGIASGWTVVGRHGRSNYAMMPVPVPGGFMVSFSRKPSISAPASAPRDRTRDSRAIVRAR